MMNRRATPFFVTGCTVKKTALPLAGSQHLATAGHGGGGQYLVLLARSVARPRGRSARSRSRRATTVPRGTARRPRRAPPRRRPLAEYVSPRSLRAVRRGARRRASPGALPRLGGILAGSPGPPSTEPLSPPPPPRVPRRRLLLRLAQTRRSLPVVVVSMPKAVRHVARGGQRVRRPRRLPNTNGIVNCWCGRVASSARSNTARGTSSARAAYAAWAQMDFEGAPNTIGTEGWTARRSMLLPTRGGARGHRRRASVPPPVLNRREDHPDWVRSVDDWGDHPEASGTATSPASPRPPGAGGRRAAGSPSPAPPRGSRRGGSSATLHSTPSGPPLDGAAPRRGGGHRPRPRGGRSGGGVRDPPRVGVGGRRTRPAPPPGAPSGRRRRTTRPGRRGRKASGETGETVRARTRGTRGTRVRPGVRSGRFRARGGGRGSGRARVAARFASSERRT